MTSRREFLQTAAALSAASLASQAGFASSQPLITPLSTAIVDSRYTDARKFGDYASSLGAAVRVIEGDITDLWQHELHGRWRAAPTAVAGLTERPALFLLERLAWDYGLRVVFEAEHAPDEAGNTTHQLVRSANPYLANELGKAGQHWPGVLAKALVVGGTAASSNFRPSDAGLAACLGETQKLYSWIIAPRTAA